MAEGQPPNERKDHTTLTRLRIHRRDHLGGLLHEYEENAA
jgi:hypothetical protein